MPWRFSLLIVLVCNIQCLFNTMKKIRSFLGESVSSNRAAKAMVSTLSDFCLCVSCLCWFCLGFVYVFPCFKNFHIPYCRFQIHKWCEYIKLNTMLSITFKYSKQLIQNISHDQL